jgi:GTPase SAR1 family protein
VFQILLKKTNKICFVDIQPEKMGLVKDEITSVKILVIGNSGVGKTSLCHRYINEIFVRSYKPTVGGEDEKNEGKKI